ncbi:5-carboxymethyl-2-hydroxymuconate semialdehyde dehydrogenase [uncultured Tateyamaria sp.]|uniref:5-carboxymethyl-2-hydroxymuconate semialdehyde dehydrogenase n=1 Tax=uncultured Tateyamaria sp. TaxID=455651 RepID=UPI0026358D72|nr:5-carboxymethyl-2-hydroxymuconate semialdehyde dehydrogenase [uncultured Tateyamaria sp.]
MTDLATHLATLAPHLSDIRTRGIPNHINGQACSAHSGMTFQTTSPLDGSLIAEVARSDASDVNTAVQAAKTAFDTWHTTTPTARKAVLHAIADGIEARAHEIALCECWDTGQAYRFMAKAAQRGADNFRYFADLAPGVQDGQSLPSPGLMNVTTRIPIGPVGVITPWNTPFMLSTWKIAPALAAGCTVVHKPAELSPWTALILSEIAKEAGLPPGVWNLINGIGHEAGRALTQHPEIKAIAFVGGTATGTAIMAQGAATLKRVHLELGGKNPIVVFDDADFERALDATLFMAYSLNGERCTSASRLLVQASIADRFEAALIKRIKIIRVGHPLDPNTDIGPLIGAAHCDKVSGSIRRAQTQGATVTAPNVPTDGPKTFIGPTLVTNATNYMDIARHEIFAPVLTSIRFTDDADALRIANDTPYGLAAYLWTSDINRAMRLMDQLDAGMIWVNTANLRHLPTPFGGMKASGIGRDGGAQSFDIYTEQKHIGIATQDPHIPRLGV